MQQSWKFLTLATVILNIEADPKCQGKTNVVCVAGLTDYVLQRGLVSDNSEAINVTLSGCRITEVSYESFMNMPNLKYIDLSHNKIKVIKIGTLDEPTQITYFNVSYNEITGLPTGIFDQIAKIQILDLKGNKIMDISVVLLQPLKNLRYLDLSSNELVGKKLKPGIFDENPLITFINFSGNDMSEASDDFLNAFKVLEYLYLNECSLNGVPTFVIQPNLKSLKYLSLSGNKISNIDEPASFLYFDDLVKLDLADNAIESLHENVFRPLTNLRVIILKENRLKTISENLFQNLPNLNTVVLSNNSLEQVPVNAFRGNSLETLVLSYNRLTYLQDNFCLELKNSGMNLKKFLFNDNPWQCACLRDILKEVKEFQIEYDDTKYKGEKPVCATTQDFNCKRQQNFNKFFKEIYYNVK